MALVWTLEKVGRLSTAEVRQLKVNVLRQGNQEVADICDAVLESRKPVPVTRARASNGDPIPRKARSPQARRLEQAAVESLIELANELLGKYDLSTEKARALSAGTKRFIPHKLLSNDGKAKVGGAQRNGSVVFDRYISYRMKDALIALNILLIDGDSSEDISYQVIGPEKLLTFPRKISEVRPYIPEGSTIGLSTFVDTFKSFSEAASHFEGLMEKLAPKVKSNFTA